MRVTVFNLVCGVAEPTRAVEGAAIRSVLPETLQAWKDSRRHPSYGDPARTEGRLVS